MTKVKVKTSMTSFLDFTLMPDSQKVKKVFDIKNNPYSVPADYWFQLRRKIKQMHSRNGNLSELDSLAESVSENRQDNYKMAIKGYKRFLSKNKPTEWFEPISKNWIHNNLSISVNPELGLIIGGIPHLIKLYFKEGTTSAEIKLNKSRAACIGFLMNNRLGDEYPENTKMALVNVKTGGLIVPDFDQKEHRISLVSSAEHFMAIWNQI